MTKRRSQNVSLQKSKAVKNNKKKSPPSLKLDCEKKKVVSGGAGVPRALSSPHRDQSPEAEAVYMEVASANLLPSLLCSNPLRSPCNVWLNTTHKKSDRFLLRHPKVLPRMRSILIDWLIEVSEAYTLHRQTLYLAQDYFDRFMLTQNKIDKSLLQLIGVTCLFIASKMEEACPPKLSQMAYVTAGTYYEHEILQMELLVLKVLRWNLCPETAVSWLQLYFQLVSLRPGSDLLEPQFPLDTFLQMTRVLDLCIIDMNSMDFDYRLVAAAVLCHFVEQSAVEKVSGLSADELQPCLTWIVPFVAVVQQFGKATLKDFKNIKLEDRHNIQTHTDYLAMLDKVDKMQRSGQFLTPPQSTEKMH